MIYNYSYTNYSMIETLFHEINVSLDINHHVISSSVALHPQQLCFPHEEKRLCFLKGTMQPQGQELLQVCVTTESTKLYFYLINIFV